VLFLAGAGRGNDFTVVVSLHHLPHETRRLRL
jgi:hypothetical protein